MTSDFQSSLTFLRSLYPSGPWMLTAISVDKKSIDARTFTPGEEEEVIAWLTLHKQKNLYYSVNQPIQDAYEKRKLSKTDIHSVHFLHVDLDPRAGEDVEEEQARILKQLSEYRTPPSDIVFSGGGYNAIWRLSRPIPIADQSPSEEETVSRAVDVERRNWQFELDFNTPDHCRDISRILRLPGTINRPDAKKVAKGRIPALARVYSSDPSRIYDYEDFMATPVVATNIPQSAEKITQNVQRVEDLDQVRPEIPEKLKVVIIQGFDPEEKSHAGDRSAPLFFVCCELVRCGVPDEVILGIITDSRFLISASVLDKGSGVMRYALRQVARARDKAFHPKLAEMNEKYAFIMDFGGKPRIMWDDDGEQRFLSPSGFCIGVDNHKITISHGGKEKDVGIGKWWMSQKRRRTYSSVVYEPGQELIGKFNLDTGFGYRPVFGDKHERYLEHMFSNICYESQENYDYLIKWMARVVQQPRTQSESAVVLQGIRGTGKTLFVESFGRLFGKHWITVADNRHLTGNFNAHLGQCVFVHADEAWRGRDIRHEGVLKTLITGPYLNIEFKGVDIQTRPNYIHLMMSSNERDAVPAGDHERRFFMLNVGERNKQQTEYFAKIISDLKSGGYENLLHHLMSIDLSDFNVRVVPHTIGLQKAQEYNLSDDREWLLEKLISGDWLDGQTSWEGPVEKKHLHADYMKHATDVKTRKPRGHRAFHTFIMEELPGTISKQLSSGTRPWVFMFPSLTECRRLFDKSRGWNYPWPSVAERIGDVIQFPGKTFE